MCHIGRERATSCSAAGKLTRNCPQCFGTSQRPSPRSVSSDAAAEPYAIEEYEPLARAVTHDDDASERLLTKALDRLRALEIRYQQKQGTQEQNRRIPQQRRCGAPAQDASVTARSPQMPPLDEVAEERLVAALARSSDAPWAKALETTLGPRHRYF